ncbi:uncharacterized protein LOC142239918 [Haematobia irritans]|uniref:uncharacterized protein LOC142239918 n=1 Tax=Haematobia irritans TaxID=7368 RepID=UPI003F5044E3
MKHYFSRIAAKRRFNLVLNNVTCTKYSTMLQRFDCDFKMLTRSNYSLNMNYIYKRTLNENAEYHFRAFFTPENAVKAVKFFDVKLNICNFLSTSMSIPLMKAIMQETRKTSNLPYECPLKAGHLYSLSNFSVSTKILPTYTPCLKFNFSIDTYNDMKIIARFIVEGATVK